MYGVLLRAWVCCITYSSMHRASRFVQLLCKEHGMLHANRAVTMAHVCALYIVVGGQNTAFYNAVGLHFFLCTTLPGAFPR